MSHFPKTLSFSIFHEKDKMYNESDCENIKTFQMIIVEGNRCWKGVIDKCSWKSNKGLVHFLEVQETLDKTCDIWMTNLKIVDLSKIGQVGSFLTCFFPSA